ncbi:MAG: CHAT domain-containing protein, partial [Cyanobacteriota bacterium]|nr:CHAT domain-containing protein [Cyanobacteriota bacterium]
RIEAALNIIESLRANVASSELRSTFFASKQDYYQFYIDLLMQRHDLDPARGYDAVALHASERARARSLLDLLAEANADIRQGVNPTLLEQERQLQLQLDAIEKRRVALYSSTPTAEQTARLERERETLISQYRELQGQIRANSPKYAALTQPQPLTLEEIQQNILDDDTLLLQYSLGEERSYLWLVGKNSFSSYVLPPGRELEAAARGFHQLLKNPRYNYRLRRSLIRVLSPESAEAVPQISQMLLGPVVEQLGNKRLVIVSDGALQYIPFAALPLPGTEDEQPVPLIADREIVHLPSTSTLGVLRQERAGRTPAPKQIALLGDPVFGPDDPRVTAEPPVARGDGRDRGIDGLLLDRAATTADVGLLRLPGTRREVEAIMALVPEAQRSQVFDFAANRDFATREQLSQYRIVHLATHGILNSTHPELSGVVLSLVDEGGNPQNGFLRLHDVFNLNLNAELVVLSACQTGLGREVKGEGLVGLTRGFMYAGAPGVLVSLWNVDDAATAEMMARFYRLLLREGKSAAAALRQAQLEMRTETEWKSPFYWAAFTLQGEWQQFN